MKNILDPCPVRYDGPTSDPTCILPIGHPGNHENAAQSVSWPNQSVEMVSLTKSDLTDLIMYAHNTANYEYSEPDIMELLKRVEPLVDITTHEIACGNSNPLQPALTCTLPSDHDERMHAADSAMGHHEWRTA